MTSGDIEQYQIKIARRYIGMPWSPAGRDVELDGGVDCLGFVSDVYQDVYGIDLDKKIRSIFNQHKSDLHEFFEEHTKPEPFDVVMIKAYSWSHIGVWVTLDGGGVLHCAPIRGVCFDSKRNFANIGLKIVGFYRFIGNNKRK